MKLRGGDGFVGDEKFKRWTLKDLPILPDDFDGSARPGILKVVISERNNGDRFKLLKKLLAREDVGTAGYGERSALFDGVQAVRAVAARCVAAHQIGRQQGVGDVAAAVAKVCGSEPPNSQ